jgi:hypothetical protein
VSRIESQEKQRVFLIGRKRVVEEINGGNNSIDSKYSNQTKGHPHPWRDGTQPDRVCKILLL